MEFPKNTKSAIKYVQRMHFKFSDTKRANLLGRISRLQRRRAKNKVAKASRKVNRP